MKKPFAYMWTTSSGRLDLVFTQDQVDSVPRSGPADDQIEVIRPLVAHQFKPEGAMDEARTYIEEAGIDGVDGMDDESVQEYIIWLAIGDIQDGGSCLRPMTIDETIEYIDKYF